MVTIWPSFISCLMTSLALTLILCARSATLIVSGMCTSWVTNSAGAVKAGESSLRSPLRAPRGERQPARPPPLSPRVLSARFLAASSAQLDDSFSDLTDFLSPGLATVLPGAAAPAAALGLWIVPLMPSLPASPGLASSGFLAVSTFLGAAIIARIAAASASADLRRPSASACLARSAASTLPDLTTRSAGLAGAGAAATGCAGGVSGVVATSGAAAAAAACAAASAAAASRSRRSCSSRARRAASSSCRRINSAWRTASASRRCTSASLITGAATSSTTAAAGASSRLTKTRFLRTSTWMVRALPEASACLISLVDLRVSVIFLRSPPVVPCALRRNSSRRSLSASVSLSSGDFLATPADCSCSSSAALGRFSSAANWATVVTAICCGSLGFPKSRFCGGWVRY